jgi:formate--tetrahydrofolate ligase
VASLIIVIAPIDVIGSIVAVCVFNSNRAWNLSRVSAAQIRRLQEEGYGHYPICVAKTQYSFSTDPQLRGAPSNHVVTIREVRLAAGAEFIVLVCGDVMTMPGLPKVPSANAIDVNDEGKIVGLF